MANDQKQAQQIARQVLRERMEAARQRAVQRRHEKADLERYQREIELVLDDLIADGFHLDTPAIWEACARIMAQRHASQARDPLESSALYRWPVD
jgi:hypothetical protein